MNGDPGAFSPLSPTSSSRASPFPHAATGAPRSAMAALLPPSKQSFRSPPVSSQPPFALPMNSVGPFDRDGSATKPIGTPYTSTPSPTTSVVIRRLPFDTTEDKLRLMLIFSKELLGVTMLPPDRDEPQVFCSAVVKFKSATGALQAKEILHGQSMSQGDIELAVDVLSESPPSSSRYPSDIPASAGPGATSATTSASSSQRQPSRYPFQSIQGMESMNGAFGASELPNPESSGRYQNLFSPQSPIGNHLTERARISGKTLISHDTAEDDETRELLKDPVAYAENGHTQQRRATAPHLNLSQLANLSLNTSNGSSSLPSYGHHAGMTPLSAHGNGPLSPTAMNNANHSINYQLGGTQHYPRHQFPPVNPADQNPPCNTLYVGNLPIDTSEEELKAMFSKQRGYKRLCFRTKQNGPMCFVEFEDISFATKALNDLYGHPLHNSVKGGIRLSFSKNPLGVRSGQSPGQSSGPIGGMNGMMPPASNGFTTANGPPPGLPGPPGLNRLAYNGSSSMQNGANTPYSVQPQGYPTNGGNPWNNSPSYHGPLSAGGTTSPMAGTSSSLPPAYMMGR